MSEGGIRGDKRDDNMKRTWPDIAGCEMDHQALNVNIKGFRVTQLSFFFFFSPVRSQLQDLQDIV